MEIILTHVGDRPPLGIHSAGIAILATLSDDEIAQAIDHNAAEIAGRFPAYVPELILEHVQATRKAGYAFNATNKVSHGIAVTIIGMGGRCVGALSIGAIPNRMQPDRVPDLAKLEAADRGAAGKSTGGTIAAHQHATLSAPKRRL
ncbi:IclR family transcriptional regulator domain-containing protein [Sphingobium tyrosinilyticum]|uniref:IclR family transcriptional regulator C-terminal domain-containing protein n=1 Tax=Sphingobium tyrosinilyticum TaxID=2715436 RepID=A0ABV9F516_9SPHN